MTNPAPVFSNSPAYRYRPCMFYLGQDDSGEEIGVGTERHAITIAGSGAGKGSTLLIPNARRWPHNLLVIDPKGEIAENSWQEREALGHKVYVLDPYNAAKVPDHVRVTWNPLSEVDLSTRTVREDLEVIADGLVKVHDPRHMEWVEGARSILAGMMAYVLADAPPELRTLQAMRAALTEPDQIPAPDSEEPQGLYANAQRMLHRREFGGIIRTTGATIIAALDNKEKSIEHAFLQRARSASAWLDTDPIRDVLSDSPFRLSVLKRSSASVYVVLPPKYLNSRGDFLRLVVRAAIAAMQDGEIKERSCLFLIDEFFALGRIDEIAISAGAMRGYGLQLWPFMQDMGQLRHLYGGDLAGTFFSNADAHIFFGNTDSDTIELVSNGLGVVTPDEVGPAPIGLRSPTISGGSVKSLMGNTPGAGVMGGIVGVASASVSAITEFAHQLDVREYQQRAQTLGKPRIPPDKVRDIIGKKDGDKVAKSPIVFAKGSDKLQVRLVPYFLNQVSPSKLEERNTTIIKTKKYQTELEKLENNHVVRASLVGLSGFFGIMSVFSGLKSRPDAWTGATTFTSLCLVPWTIWLLYHINRYKELVMARKKRASEAEAQMNPATHSAESELPSPETTQLP